MLNQNYMEIFMEEHQNKYRYERKYLIERNMLSVFLTNLYANNFYEKFPKRRINNLYYDSYDFSSLTDNLDGLSIRNKYRVRWYGNSFEKNDKTIEVKQKSEFLNKKQKLKIGSWTLISKKNINNFSDELVNFLNEKKHYLFYYYLNTRYPTLFNSYERQYFVNNPEKVRITIDTNLSFYSPISMQTFNESKIVIEVKHDKQINFFNIFDNLILTRYSKYAKGTIQTSNYTPSY